MPGRTCCSPPSCAGSSASSSGRRDRGWPACGGWRPSRTHCRPRPCAPPRPSSATSTTCSPPRSSRPGSTPAGCPSRTGTAICGGWSCASGGPDELEQIESEFAVGDDEVEAALPAEAVCTGFLRRAAERLAEDAALAATDDDGEDSADRAALIAALTREAEAVRGRAPSPPEVEREIAAHASRLDPDRGRDARARRRRGGARSGALRPRRRPPAGRRRGRLRPAGERARALPGRRRPGAPGRARQREPG